MNQHQNQVPNGGNGTGMPVTGAGTSQDQRTIDGKHAQTLTTRQGHPLTNNQNLRTLAGADA